jgi:predicted glutamine amidotransferase
MCIIIAKNSGVELPKHEILENCFDNNPHGAGIMYRRNKESVIHIAKGFMKLKELKRAITKLELKKEDSIVYHFRFATHGGKSAVNTHPFPISDKVKDLKALIFKTDIGMCHNGIIPIALSQPDISDTMEFVKAGLAEWKKEGVLFSKSAIKIMKEDTGWSKYAFLESYGNVRIIGTGWSNVKGLLFSNDGYLKTTSWTTIDYTGWTSKYTPAGYVRNLERVENAGWNRFTSVYENDDLYVKKLTLESRIDDLANEIEFAQDEHEAINLTAERDCLQQELDMLEAQAWEGIDKNGNREYYI